MIEAFQRAVSSANQNTYKFALGRAIIEEYKGNLHIPLSLIASRFAEYYYKNQIVFKIHETNNPSQEPTAVLILRKLVKNKYGDFPPPHRITKKFRDDFAGKLLNPPTDWGHSVFTYVLPCWQGAKKNSRGYYDYPRIGRNDFWDYSMDDGFIALIPEFAKTIDLYRSILLSLVILEWASFLEKFNQTPNLISKLSAKKPLRRLSKFRIIFEQVPRLKANVCHLCRTHIPLNDFTLDHIIPYDYVYSDDLWNLVPAHRNCNSKKGARIGSKRMIRELIERNYLLWNFQETLTQKWIRSYAASGISLENKILSIIDAAIKAGFSQVKDSDF
ncbi:HNH endonuclease [Thermodesulfobacteriota bacterium]